MRVTSPYDEQCPSAHAGMPFMVGYLPERGYGGPELRDLLQRIRAAGSATSAMEIQRRDDA
jgi:hypothetical protein